MGNRDSLVKNLDHGSIDWAIQWAGAVDLAVDLNGSVASQAADSCPPPQPPTAATPTGDWAAEANQTLPSIGRDASWQRHGAASLQMPACFPSSETRWTRAREAWEAREPITRNSERMGRPQEVRLVAEPGREDFDRLTAEVDAKAGGASAHAVLRGRQGLTELHSAGYRWSLQELLAAELMRIASRAVSGTAVPILSFDPNRPLE